MSGSSKKLLQAAAGSAGGDNLYVEDVFSTYLYTGNGATRTITNGIDLDGEGGLLMIKNRTTAEENPVWDSTRSYTEGVIRTNASNNIYSSVTDMFTGFTDSGFTLGADATLGWVNTDTDNYVSWSFRKAEKFMDVVSYTGTGANTTFSHSLGVVPAMIIVKRIDSTGTWAVYHKDLTSAVYKLILNELGAQTSAATAWNSTDPTDSVFSVGTSGETNVSDGDYVAYLFASDAGGFGDDGSENIIKCGSYTGNGSTDGPVVDVGFEPQWLLIKRTSATENWPIYDNMRGMAVGGTDTILMANRTNSESSYAGQNDFDLTATGFKLVNNSGRVNESDDTYVYVAIRRPMKTPESGAEVFDTLTYTGNGASTRNYDMGITVDAVFQACRSDTNDDKKALSARLTQGQALQTTAISAVEYDVNYDFDFQTGVRQTAADTKINQNSETFFMHGFKRAPGFFDIVAYQGNSTADRTIAHNLGVIPELSIYKHRFGGDDAWWIHTAETAVTEAFLFANAGAVRTNESYWNTRPTASVFTVQSTSAVNGGYPYISYHWATLEGVSKVGKYTGTGNDVDVDCGFAAGARFLLIKRINGSGDWYVWDSARGIIAGNDPSIVMNTSAAEVTNTDYIDPLAAGFTVTSSAPDALNVDNGTYLFLAIA